ncbi:MAG: hypothetical protein IJ426_01170 [Clostridia bacterium]|nr:hypothetical protein [Clostridia bacterium]
MKAIICALCLMLLFCGCGKDKDTTSTPSSTSSGYIDADTDFTGKKTIIGRWQCITETQNGETKDVSGDGIYYIFSSDKTLDTFYTGENMGIYSGYELGDGTVTLNYSSGGGVTLEYKVDEKTLTLTLPGGAISTYYERVPYEK